MKNMIVSQALALCFVLVYQTVSCATATQNGIVVHHNGPTGVYEQRNFNFGGMYSTVVKYVVRAVNFTYNLINSPPVCHLLNNCKDNQIHAPIPLQPSGGGDGVDYDHHEHGHLESHPYSVQENIIAHDTLTNPEYTGPLIDALLSANVDNVKSHEGNTKDSSALEDHEELHHEESSSS